MPKKRLFQLFQTKGFSKYVWWMTNFRQLLAQRICPRKLVELFSLGSGGWGGGVQERRCVIQRTPRASASATGPFT